MPPRNSYRKYFGPEDKMQEAVCTYLGYAHKNLLWWHTPNEGKRSEFEQTKFKALGGKRGVSDIILLEESNFAKGLVIELKCGKNHCTTDQIDFLVNASKRRYTASVVYDSSHAVIKLIERHLKTGICLPGDGIYYIKGKDEKIIPLDKAHEQLRPKTRVKKTRKGKLFNHP